MLDRRSQQDQRRGPSRLLVDGCWIEDPDRIKEEVHQFFRKRFEESEEVRPRLDGVIFQVIAQNQNDFLIDRFHEKEVKDAS